MDYINVNPTSIFYDKYETDVLKSRELLFNELDQISIDFGNEARKLLNSKIKSNNGIPLLGELFPWIIKDLIKANTVTTGKISVGWLAIYLYTLFLDEHVDNPKPIEPANFLMGSLLAKTGIMKLTRFTYNTDFDLYLDRVFSYSAKNQYMDVKYNKLNIDNDFKESYSKGKNYIVLACAGALASQNSQHADFIIQFTNQLLITLQFLDDIGDYKEDFELSNFTVLLNDAISNRPYLLKSLNKFTKRDLLIELIETGSLLRVLRKVDVLLTQSILLLNDKNIPNNLPSFEFFNTLMVYNLKLIKYLEENCDKIKLFQGNYNDSILDKVENYIKIIAQSS